MMALNRGIDLFSTIMLLFACELTFIGLIPDNDNEHYWKITGIVGRGIKD
jgi:hypothetical protein